MIIDRYRLSFTIGGIFLHEAPIVTERYLALRDWSLTRDQVRQDNLLQVRTEAASLRISKELVSRLELLDLSELEELLCCSLQDRGYLLWVAACRHYAMIADFAIEVLRDHYLLRRQLSFCDYEAFYSSKALLHPELDEVAITTQSKLRQNIFRMLREAGLISGQQIQFVMISSRLAQLLARRGHDALMVFPAADNDMKRWLT